MVHVPAARLPELQAPEALVIEEASPASLVPLPLASMKTVTPLRPTSPVSKVPLPLASFQTVPAIEALRCWEKKSSPVTASLSLHDALPICLLPVLTKPVGRVVAS